MKKLTLSLLLIFWVSISIAQPSKPNPYFNAIIVGDIDKSVDWYKMTLGFEEVNRAENKERGVVQVNMVVGSALIELIELKQNVIYPNDILVEQPPKTKMAGLFKFGFSVKDFDDWVMHFVNSKTEIYGSVVQDNSGKKMVIILDPDGNRVQVFEE